MAPRVDTVALLHDLTEALRERDSEGEASVVFDVGTAERQASINLWADASLRFWIAHRRFIGPSYYWEVIGVVPISMVSEVTGPRQLDITGTAEIAVELLAMTATLLFRKIVIDTPTETVGTEDQARTQEYVLLFVRARTIRQQLERIASEKHDGPYRKRAFSAHRPGS